MKSYTSTELFFSNYSGGIEKNTLNDRAIHMNGRDDISNTVRGGRRRGRQVEGDYITVDLFPGILLGGFEYNTISEAISCYSGS